MKEQYFFFSHLFPILWWNYPKPFKIEVSNLLARVTSDKMAENKTCSICLENLNQASEIDSCDHQCNYPPSPPPPRNLYSLTDCHDCILTWSTSSNTCPQCRKRFHKITKLSLEVLFQYFSIFSTNSFHRKRESDTVIQKMM
jgi:hypothetical protein